MFGGILGCHHRGGQECCLMSYSTQDSPKHGHGMSGEAWLQIVGWGMSSGSHGTDFSTQILGKRVAWAMGPVMAMGGAEHWGPSVCCSGLRCHHTGPGWSTAPFLNLLPEKHLSTPGLGRAEPGICLHRATVWVLRELEHSMCLLQWHRFYCTAPGHPHPLKASLQATKL